MPARPTFSYPMSAAQLAARENIPADVAYQAISALGADVNESDFRRMYGQATLAGDLVGPTSRLPLDQLPPGDLIQDRQTVTSTGYLYQFSVAAIDQESGENVDIPYSIRTPELIEPGEGIEAAIVSQTLRAPDYNLKILGGQLTGVFSLQPEEE